MSTQSPIEIATANLKKVPDDWMPAAQVRAFIFEDPGVVWLQYHGEKHGFQPDSSPYAFINFILEKGRQFEKKWYEEIAPNICRVCSEGYDVLSFEKVKETYDLMQSSTPIIAQPALWWAPEAVYGIPDLIVHTSWIREKFPNLLSEDEIKLIAPNLRGAWDSGHYIVLDIKFTTKLEETQKVKDFENYKAQVRIYSYILGHIQGLMPRRSFIITRDRIFNPISVNILSELNRPLDADLADIRNKFLEIKLNGAKYVPWKDDIIEINISKQDEKWDTAKKIIANEKISGRDSGLLYQVSHSTKRELESLGFPNLDSMLKVNPQKIPFEKCRGLGAIKSKQIRAILQANRNSSPVLPPSDSIPIRKQFEFYVDFEYLTNVNVDFDRQWPTLDGCEMIFMVGIGWEDSECWFFKTFIAEKEDQKQEFGMFEKFLTFLRTQTEDALTDSSRTAFYHWSSAEKWQSGRTADRHGLPSNHLLRNLPWYDLQRIFLNCPCSVPGAWDYGLKEVAQALGKLDPQYDPQWPKDLSEGLQAMVMGWKAYQTPNLFESYEMKTLTQYLEADCKALLKILKWLRTSSVT